MALHLHAATIVVPDYDEALGFYVDKAGFGCLADRDLGNGKRWVLVTPDENEGPAILLAKAHGARQERAVGNQTGGRVAFFLATSDFASDHARMIDRGVPFEEAPRHEAYGTVAVWSDPFGNRWDLVQLTA